MTTLQTRLAQADKPTRELLEEVWEAIHGPKPPRIHGGSQELTDWLHLHNPFYRMIDAEAWTSAVEMLEPEIVNRYPQIYYIGPNPNNSRDGHRYEFWTKECGRKPIRAQHPHSKALALAIACLKARGL